jgi:hypothetical protein
MTTDCGFDGEMHPSACTVALEGVFMQGPSAGRQREGGREGWSQEFSVCPFSSSLEPLYCVYRVCMYVIHDDTVRCQSHLIGLSLPCGAMMEEKMKGKKKKKEAVLLPKLAAGSLGGEKNRGYGFSCFAEPWFPIQRRVVLPVGGQIWFGEGKK